MSAIDFLLSWLQFGFSNSCTNLLSLSNYSLIGPEHQIGSVSAWMRIKNFRFDDA